MKRDIVIEGRFISKFTVPKEYIKDLNIRYEKAKKHLTSYGPRLAGRIDSELNMMTLIERTKAFKFIIKCMNDHLRASEEFRTVEVGPHHLDITGCWINDMVEGEYNPPHTHHDGSGWSTVLFLKVPKFINDAKDPHKFKDGHLGFIMEGKKSHYIIPKVGDFYIFRADHQHCVLSFKTKTPNEIRRSMSFNFTEKPNV